MSKKSASLGEQVRQIADRLKQETNIQIKATSRILGAAAQIAENHERLIDEVVDMAEEDLQRKNQLTPSVFYTVESLKQQYKTLREAKTHFGLKVNSWESLVNKLNHQSTTKSRSNSSSLSSLSDRLTVIESEIKDVRADLSQILSLLKQILLNKE